MEMVPYPIKNCKSLPPHMGSRLFFLRFYEIDG